jgi:predicted metal-dependent hydrolase
VATSSLTLTLSDGHNIDATINARRGAKRMTLRVDPISRQVVINGPLRLSKRDALAFLTSSQNWIEARLSLLPDKAPFAEGSAILFRGRETRLQRVAGRGAPIFLDGETPSLIISGSAERFETRVRAALKAYAQNDALLYCDQLSPRLGKAPKSLSLRDTRSRWGSCTSAGDVMVSWRLVGAPPKVFEYVVAHELAHLVEMNHSARFWNQVSALMPDWKPARAWLKAHGAALHALGR